MKKLSRLISSPDKPISPEPISETPQLINSQAGFRISYKGKELIPSGTTEKILEKSRSIKLEDNTLYILCSPLLWHGVIELILRLPKGSGIVIIEVDPVLRGLTDWRIESQNLPGSISVHCCLLHETSQICTDIARQFKRNTRQIRFLSINGGRHVHAAAYHEIEVQSEFELRRFWRNRSTLLYMGPLWIRNFINNVINSAKAKDIENFPPQEHVVVCGAGPSIEATIPLLRKFRDRIYLVAVDTALPILEAFGVIPDLVVALDGQIANVADFIPAWRQVKAIAFDIASNPVILRTCQYADAWFFSSDFAEGAHWKRAQDTGNLPSRIPALGSVGVSAVYLCHFFSNRNVYLTGLDFGYIPGLTHGRHSPAYLKYLNQMNRLSGSFPENSSLTEKVKFELDHNGLICCTDSILLSYRDSLKEVILFLEAQGKNVYDLRTFGLSLGAPTLSETELVEKLQSTTPTMAKFRAQKTEYEKNPKKFLESLLFDIENCLSTIKPFLQTETTIPPETGAKILSDLTELDFLFYDCADSIWPNLERGALARAYIKLGYFQKLINRRLNHHQI